MSKPKYGEIPKELIDRAEDWLERCNAEDKKKTPDQKQQELKAYWEALAKD